MAYEERLQSYGDVPKQTHLGSLVSIQSSYILCIGGKTMKSTTINLSLPAQLLKLIDQEAKAELRTRSELLREAARSYLAREQRWRTLQRYAGQRAKAAGIRTETDLLKTIASLRKSSRGSKT